MLKTIVLENGERDENLYLSKKVDYQNKEERAIMHARMIELMIDIGFNPN